MKKFIDRYTESLNSSSRPIILAGRGVRASSSVTLFKQLIDKWRIPVVTSLLGLDVLSYAHPSRVGFIGTYGNRWANNALGSCDVLLVLGSRLDVRQTGELKSFAANKTIYHVDIDNAELNNRVKGCEVLNVDLKEFLSCVNDLTYECPIEWIDKTGEMRRDMPDTKELRDVIGINPNVFIHQLSKVSKGAKVITADTGNNQMWCAQSLELSEGQLFLTSGGMGAMGYSLPAAIGASLTLGAPVVSISGDGGFQINIQELQTIKRNNLPIKMVVFNNNSLGMIKQFQDIYFGGYNQGSVSGYSAPDFARVARAYGIDSATISHKEEAEDGLKRLWSDPLSPFLLEVMIDINTKVSPKINWGEGLIT